MGKKALMITTGIMGVIVGGLISSSGNSGAEMGLVNNLQLPVGCIVTMAGVKALITAFKKSHTRTNREVLLP